MPEICEVETCRLVITPLIVGKSITDARVLDSKLSISSESLVGRTFSDTSRRGKYLVLGFLDGGHMTVHFRMTGALVAAPKGHAESRFCRMVMTLDDGSELRFLDSRRLGTAALFDAHEIDVSGIASLGIDPLADGVPITGELLQSAYGRTKRAVKECLMEQSCVAGIGNIYAGELLFLAGIMPKRSACTLSDVEWERIASLIRPTLEFFTEKNAITAEEYLAGGGWDYRNTPYLNVYGREGKQCKRCGGTLERIVIGGRGGCYCETCQK